MPKEFAAGPLADAPRSNWVDRFAPNSLKPWLRLVRADRPIGAWLLMWPCWWSVALSVRAEDDFVDLRSDIRPLLLFMAGAFAMRSAGCIYNDIIDRDIDAKVARTKGRPLASGQSRWRRDRLHLGAVSGGSRGSPSIRYVCGRVGLRLGRRRSLITPFDEAGYVLAASGARPSIFLRRPYGLGSLLGRPGARPDCALRRCHRLDNWLRHHIRAPGQGGRHARGRSPPRCASATALRPGSACFSGLPSADWPSRDGP